MIYGGLFLETLNMRVTDSQIIKGVHEYVVLLKRNHPFNSDDPVIIIASEDYKLLTKLYRDLKADKDDLHKQLKKKNDYINLLEQHIKEEKIIQKEPITYKNDGS